MPRIVVFAPSPVLTVTVEDHPDGPDVHLHAGGQGIWQARMLRTLGVDVTVTAALTGETGKVVRSILQDEGIRLEAVVRGGRGGAYVHDRRGGERDAIVETGGEPLTRHDLDELYGITLREALAADLVVLSGPASKNALPHDVYRRLAADLGTAGIRVVVDLAGDRLDEAVAGGVSVAKVSDEELHEQGRIEEYTVDQIVAAMHRLHEEGAESVVITRAEDPFLLLTDGQVHEITAPRMEVADPKGAGDSLTAGMMSALSRGESVLDAVMLGAAAGALNVTRHGLGTGDPEAIARLRELVTSRVLGDETSGTDQQEES